jgi:hypothetical protein
MDEVKLVNNISHTEIRSILSKHGNKWTDSKKTVLSSNSEDPEYNLKKAH